MNPLQKFESLCEEISIQKGLYRDASEKDEIFEVKRKLISKLRELEKELNHLRKMIQERPD